MQGMSFDEGGSSPIAKKQGKITKFLISKGIAKDAAQASKIMLGASIVFILVAVFLFMSGGSDAGYNIDERYQDPDIATE